MASLSKTRNKSQLFPHLSVQCWSPRETAQQLVGMVVGRVSGKVVGCLPQPQVHSVQQGTTSGNLRRGRRREDKMSLRVHNSSLEGAMKLKLASFCSP